MQLKPTWVRIGLLIATMVVIVGAAASIALGRAGPILKARITETLSARFNSRVELASLNVSIFRGFEVSGERLLIYPPGNVVAAGFSEPLISVERFAFHSGFLGFLREPAHVGTVRVTNLEINIPPRELRRSNSENGGKAKGKIRIVVDQILCERSRLTIGTSKPDKDPKVFELTRIDLRDVGPNKPWSYDATLTNAVPRGDIHASGAFGPWQTEDPGGSPVTGHYTFDRADLNTIKGIGGMLSSVGDFSGQLDKITVDGTTKTPNFSLDTANRPLPLHTQFHAIVDGTTGDTYLQTVNARLKNSSFTTSGVVINIKGQGHRIELNVDVSNARVEDFLDLAVKTKPAVVTGRIDTKTKLWIPPGEKSVSQKLELQGNVVLHGIHFTNPRVQDKLDTLSLRARGKPKQAKPGAPDVTSRMSGHFDLRNGALHFSDLSYVLPGARVNLVGVYSLDGQEFDFRGKLLTDASLSEMVDSRVASVLLKVISPFFRNARGGAEIPVSISGTESEPKFGLDVFKKHANLDSSSGK
jgi:hypothetical protein